ncbi:MAG: GNAT family N-acetyltransferase, partial [Gammaproteobacteria bacterium]|nr:GNAT family N-acetyltransferase [Gammaproteobacteria bacterium]
MTIRFQKLTKEYQKTVFDWLEEPHMKEFWDNSQGHKDDIINFINGRIELSSYFNGIMTYWIGFVDEQPFCFILTSEMRKEQDDITELHREHLSKTGHTIALDFGIGNPLFMGKGLAAPTL